VAFLGWLSVTRAALAASLTVTANASTTPGAGEASGAAEFGLTAMIGVPLVTLAVTVYDPAKTDWVVSTPPAPALHVDGVGDEAGAES
jgi:hypothetical protein